jgi:hypothetical protein
MWVVDSLVDCTISKKVRTAVVWPSPVGGLPKTSTVLLLFEQVHELNNERTKATVIAQNHLKNFNSFIITHALPYTQCTIFS